MSQTKHPEKELTKKEQRMKQTVRLYYGEDLTQREVAERIGVRRKTIQRYLNDPAIDKFVRPYSDKEESSIREHLEEKRKEVEELTEEVVDEVVNSGVSPDKKLKAVKELRNDTDSLVEFLDATGVLRKEPERHEIQHGGEVSVVDRLREAVDEVDGSDA